MEKLLSKLHKKFKHAGFVTLRNILGTMRAPAKSYPEVPNPSSDPEVMRFDRVFFCDAQIEKFHAFQNNGGHDGLDLPTIRALVQLTRQCHVELVIDRYSGGATAFLNRVDAAFHMQSEAHSRFIDFLEALDNFMEQEDQDCLLRISRLLG